MEESYVNRDEKTAVTYTRNLTYTNIMTCEERCQFSVSPDCKNWYDFHNLFLFFDRRNFI